MTMKFLSVLAFVAASYALPAQAATITFTTLSAPVAGSSFDVAVRLTGVFTTHPGDAIAGFGFNVTPSARYSYTGETIGSLFDDFSGVFGPSPQVAGIATAGFLQAGDFAEPLTLATLHFLAITPGPAAIGITTDLSDPNQGLFYLTAGSESLNATGTLSIAGIPEPGTMLAGSLALGCILLYRRRES